MRPIIFQLSRKDVLPHAADAQPAAAPPVPRAVVGGPRVRPLQGGGRGLVQRKVSVKNVCVCVCDVYCLYDSYYTPIVTLDQHHA